MLLLRGRVGRAPNTWLPDTATALEARGTWILAASGWHLEANIGLPLPFGNEAAHWEQGRMRALPVHARHRNCEV